jgi:hypothetical protein
MALLAPNAGAATISGRVTECCGANAAPRHTVVAYEELSIAFPDALGRCQFPNLSQRAVGTAESFGDGSYSITYTPTQRLPQHCSFEARVFVEVSRLDGGLVVSSKTPREDAVVIDDLDMGLGPTCPDPLISFAFEGPSLLLGQPGETVTFDVFVLLTTECVAGPAGPDSWITVVSADGGNVVGASADGTVAALTTADPPGLFLPCGFRLMSVSVALPDSDAECVGRPIAVGSAGLFESCTTRNPLGLPLGSSHRILRVTVEAVIPPLGETGSCRLFFPNLCRPAPGVNLLRNVSLFGFDVVFPELSEHQVTLRALSVMPPFRRGDMNASGQVDISDAISTFGYLFLGDGDPLCLSATDSNGDGAVDISDGLNTLNYLFSGEAEIPAPGPQACGEPPAEDPSVGCEEYDRC